ncbi:hypothetical protein HGG78_01965 [Vibrio aestuarianus]|uniref:hypothetical protein n=1 Tax=Vibrio aestuarianus TaxID=28171 RepID=UPI0006A5BA30|nr:hypothetical protein [Vibrio aestuarianus]KOE82832.1 hypothetical protein ACS86_08385 [Vibrio alginolyticus]MDE1332568.1 hypothetical protein [Vibrio aestuarianus]NGZ12538.1 hypothetical protein [Vibrio aestuarianus]NKZ48686.1 hypothetical protein [Vibrio aestuarianus]CAH8242310.1 conserved hypothetical protein [Vibrio aestuarianus]
MKKNLQQLDRENAKRYLKPRSSSRKPKTIFEGIGIKELSKYETINTLFNKPILPIPEYLDLSIEGFSQELVVFFALLENLLMEHNHIYLSFKETKKVRLPMFLMIVALQDKYKAKISIIWATNDHKTVNRSIIEAGSFDSAAIRRATLADSNDRRIPVISGSNAEFVDFPDILVDAIRDKYYGGDIPSEVEEKISQAITETLENVGRHAYPEENKDINKKWWLICSVGQSDYHSNDKYMYLAIYDAGRGIPSSFPDSPVFQNRVRKHYPNEYNQLIHGNSTGTGKRNAIVGLARTMKSYVTPFRAMIGDSGLIFASMMQDLTRLDDEDHGQGSKSIKDVITEDTDSKLLVFSNKGCYQYNKGHSEEHTRVEHSHELPGTMLQWSINLDELD